MSKLLVNFVLGSTKALLTTYTWTTLPLYTIAQRPWRRLKQSKSFGVQATKDATGRIIYSRPCQADVKHPYFGLHSLNQIVPLLDRKREIIGFRPVLSEQLQLDENGNPIKIDGKILKRITLANEFRWHTVEEIMNRADALGRGLQAMGVKSGEKVVLLADNSVEWFCTALALQRINAITVTLLSILNDDGILYATNQSEARFMVTSQELLNRLGKISNKFEQLRTIIYIPDKLKPNDAETQSTIATLADKNYFQVTTLDQVQEVGSQMEPSEFPIPGPNDISLIMYTSGTSGNPKGVMLSNRTLLETVYNILRIQEETKTPILNTNCAVYLPMAHIFGFLLSLGLFVTDSKLAICNPTTMLDSSPAHVPGQRGDFHLVKPEFMGSVPLVLDRILKEITRKLQATSPIAVPLFNYVMDYKIRWASRGYDSPIINRLVCRKINDQFGGNFRVMLVGSAPLNEQTQARVQAALNVKLIQAYGLTETGASGTTMMSTDLTYGHCGVPFHSVKYYLKDWSDGGYSTSDKPNPRGEIVIGGPTVADGYFKLPTETKESFKVDPDGTKWFETGDIGEVLPNGTLKIIDRKKDLTKLANGEFVSLGKIEAGLRSCHFVENICVCTDPYSNYVTALISPNRKSLGQLAVKLAKPSDVTFEQLCADPEVTSHVLKAIKGTSKQLGFAGKETPHAITLVTEEWSQDNNLLTAALKMKRKQVNKFYRAQIKQMFTHEKKQ